MLAEVIIRVLALSVAGLFAVAITHKIHLIRGGKARLQPLVRRRGWGGRRATTALAAAAVVEVAVVGALIVRPGIGLLVATGLLLLYTSEVRHLAPDESCGCLGGALETHTRSGAIRRNMALVAIALSAGLAHVTGLVGVAAVSQLTVGVALLFLATALALTVIQREANLARSR